MAQKATEKERAKELRALKAQGTAREHNLWQHHTFCALHGKKGNGERAKELRALKAQGLAW